MKIIPITKRLLRKELHSAMFNDCAELLRKVDTEDVLYREAKANFLAAYEAVEDCYELPLKDPMVETIQQTNKLRCDTFCAMRANLKGLVRAGFPEKEKAEILLTLCDRYRVSARDNVQGTTSLIRNFLDDLDTAEMQEAVDSCLVRFFHDRLVTLNGEVAKYREESYAFRKNRRPSAYRLKRKEADAVYNETVQVLEALSCVAPEVYEELVRQWNAVVRYYKRVLRQQQGIRLAEEEREEAEEVEGKSEEFKSLEV